MRISYDPAKDRVNREKHGLPLDLAETVIFNAASTFLDTRFDYGEDRFVSFGNIDGRLHVAVWTERDGMIRVISVRKANTREQNLYG